MVPCPMAQRPEMPPKPLDFALPRRRGAAPPRELRIDATEAGPSVVLALWDSGPPLPVGAEQRLVSPFRLTQTGGGGEVEVAPPRALAQSTGGSLRRPVRGGTSGGGSGVTRP